MYPFRLFEYVLNTLEIHPKYALNTMYSEVAPRYTTDTLGYTADTVRIHQIHAKYTCIRCVQPQKRLREMALFLVRFGVSVGQERPFLESFKKLVLVAVLDDLELRFLISMYFVVS